MRIWFFFMYGEKTYYKLSNFDSERGIVGFQGLVEQGIYTIPTEISLMWVRERIIPSGRQNLHYLVKERKLAPLFCATKENMYLKADIERLRSE